MPEPSNIQVVLMGLITVFAALIILIVMIKLMSGIINILVKDNKSETQSTADAKNSQEPVVEQSLKVAMAVAIAQGMGTDVTGLRIRSIKRL